MASGSVASTDEEVVGLIPAAGHALRLAPLPFSKELYPIGLTRFSTTGRERPKTACHYLLEKLRIADITRAYMVIREGKWDIPGYFRDGSIVGLRLGYFVVGSTAAPPYSLDVAYPFVRRATVAFGFPDILFEGDDAFRQLLRERTRSNADIVLGLFPADCPEKMDMVDVDEKGRVTDLVIQPTHTSLEFSWDIAVWTSVFTEFLHTHLDLQNAATPERPVHSVGHVIQAAIREGLKVVGIKVSDQPYCDIGTPEGLAQAMRRFALLG
jgi:glucose-1-phosphate thymidylyltransferase